MLFLSPDTETYKQVKKKYEDQYGEIKKKCFGIKKEHSLVCKICINCNFEHLCKEMCDNYAFSKPKSKKKAYAFL